METVIDQPLSDIPNMDVVALLKPIREHNLVQGWRIVRQSIRILQLGANVIGIEDRDLGNLLQTLRSVCEDVAQRADVHAELAVIRLDLPDRLRTLVVEQILSFGTWRDDGVG